jgi:ABC-type amino acid transport substrate-binding protein
MMKLVLLVCILNFALFASAQFYGNDELRSAINAALSEWQTSGDAATSWNNWYGDSVAYDAPGTCSGSYIDNPTEGGTLDAVISRGVLRIGSDFPSPPLYFTQGGSSTVVGFDQDFANFLTGKLSAKYNKTITSTRVATNFGDLITTLNSTSFPYDVASGGMYVTDARAALANFACNISIGSVGGAILSSRASEITSVEDVAKAGFTVGVLNATVQFTTLADAGATVIPVANMDDAWPLLENGTIDAWVGSRPTIAYWSTVNTDKAVTVLPQWGASNGVAWAVRKDTESGPSTTTSTSGASMLVAGAAAVAGFVALL